MELTRSFPYLVNATVECRPSNDDQFNLFLTVRFGEDKFRFILGGISIAIKRAFINLPLVGCEGPEESWSFDQAPKPKLRVREKVTTREKRTGRTKGAVKARASIHPQLEASAEHQDQSEEYTEIRDAFDTTLALIRARGNKSHPSWTFRVSPTDEFLEGAILKEQLLCKLRLFGENAKIHLAIEFPIDGLLVRTGNRRFGAPVNKFSVVQLLLRKFIRDQIHVIGSVEIRQDTENE
jgi:hypothetical protein